jgi:hypothetical protein
MLVRLGEIIYWIAAVCAVLWLGFGIWVYYIDPDPPSEATFVLQMFIRAGPGNLHRALSGVSA